MSQQESEESDDLGKNISVSSAPNGSLVTEQRGNTCRGEAVPRPVGFNPRPRARGDRNIHIARWQVLLFQSTPPSEGRLLSTKRVKVVAHVSIHAPERGAIPKTRGHPYGLSVSIHAPERGAISPIRSCPQFLQFQSTPPSEGRYLLMLSLIHI